MKVNSLTVLAALAVEQVAAHATFQQLWVNGLDMISLPCARVPPSNSPIENVSSNNIRCNAGTSPAAAKCPVKAGDTVTVEMHQHNSRDCGQEAIGGAHYGPVMAYLSKVDNAATADGSTSFFKIYQNSWARNPTGGSGDDDYWGNKDMNKCCGRVDVKIPSDIAPGDYLLRAETIALHSAGGSGGAQFYMTCYQITVTGGGSASPAGVRFPGAYAASDPGILVNIHSRLNGYTAPGPAVYAGGTTKIPGGSCTGCENTCKPGSGPATTLPVQQPTNTGGGAQPTGGNGGCTVGAWAQCGGQGYTGCTKCATGTCVAVSPPHYYQCQG
ncbi:Endo-beta-1,4-glucanase D [Paramyrothecium foliicola]|nr:Endo-beta-1,4-glucanase D [Paramyrothecium foliicola]